MAASKSAELAAIEGALFITRTLKAPRDLVFKAWTDPERVIKWMGPRDYPAVEVKLDPRVGGKWRICLRPAHGGPDLWQGGEYREIVENERLVFSFAWDKEHPATGHEMVVTIKLSDAEGGGTTLNFRQDFLPTKGERDGHEGGWNSTFDRLEDFLRA